MWWRGAEFCKKEKTLKLERTFEFEDEICFSRSPIAVCRRHCVPESTARRAVSLVCMPRHDATARLLLAKYHAGKTLLTDDIQAVSSSLSSRVITKQVDVADRCVSETF